MCIVIQTQIGNCDVLDLESAIRFVECSFTTLGVSSGGPAVIQSHDRWYLVWSVSLAHTPTVMMLSLIPLSIL